jgi:antitoxin component HigA of HigAB toxin-antitoxin module
MRVPIRRSTAMTHLFDPPALAGDADYSKALDELEDLMLADPGTPAGRRFDELVVLIEEYEARRDGYDLARMRRALAEGPP